MGVAIYLLLEKDIEGLDAFVNGKAVASAADQLDAIAGRIGVRPLMDFFSLDPAIAPELLPEGYYRRDEFLPNMPPQVWHDPAAGLATVRALQKYLTENPDAAPGSNRVREDLEDMERILEAAGEHKVRWSLQVDF